MILARSERLERRTEASPQRNCSHLRVRRKASSGEVFGRLRHSRTLHDFRPLPTSQDSLPVYFRSPPASRLRPLWQTLFRERATVLPNYFERKSTICEEL